MKSLKELEVEIEKIKSRNHRVEADKAWETSFVRRVFISITTYILISLCMYILKVKNPLKAAIIPAIAYLLSTLTLGFLKSWWINKR